MPKKIERRGDSSYRLTVVHKQQVYRTNVTAIDEQDAANKWVLFKAEILKGKALDPNAKRMTLSEFYQYWKTHYSEEHHEVTTQELTSDVFTRIELALGHLQIDKIEPRHILSFYDQLKKPTASENNTPLSPAYIRKHASVLKTIMSAAYQWEFIVSNPCEKVKLPKLSKTQKKMPTEDDLHQFFNALDKHKILKHKLWVSLAFSLGLRREEIFGLKWGAVDLKEQTLSIELAAVYVPKKGIIIKDTKTDNSYRKLSMPSDLTAMFMLWQEEVITEAKKYKKRKKIVDFKDNPIAEDRWVFPQRDGSVGHPHSFTTFAKVFCRENGIEPAISPHKFRHMSGSYLLNAGVDLAAVSAKLGHADKSFTMKTYIHELQSAEKQSAVVMQTVLDDIKLKVAEKRKAEHA